MMKSLIIRFFTGMLFSLMLLPMTALKAAEQEPGAELFMRDGQLKSHPISVFVTKDISESMNPRLFLVTSHALTKETPGLTNPIKAKLVARGQRSWQTIQGEPNNLTGTLMLFDIKKFDIPYYKGMIRVVPVLKWDEEHNGKVEEHTLIGPQEVNVGNIIPAAIWTLLVIALLIYFIIFIARKAKKSVISLLCGPKGRLSLANTQFALWTIGVGTLVAGYGFLRFEVPDVPESLVVLMGLSFVTGGVSQYRSSSEKAKMNAEVQAAISNKPKLVHLLSEVRADGSEVLSLSRAQMIFWTGVTLILFIVKSILDGVLWEVPWEMVAFMGISQLGYLGPKWMPQQETATAQAPQPEK